jgi:hypothetical protein
MSIEYKSTTISFDEGSMAALVAVAGVMREILEMALTNRVSVESTFRAVGIQAPDNIGEMLTLCRQILRLPE